MKNRRLDKYTRASKRFQQTYKIIKTYCFNVFNPLFMFIFLSFNSSFFSSLISNKHIYIMFIMSILCPSLNFFTKRNDKAEKKAREKREEIYIYALQYLSLQNSYDHELIHIVTSTLSHFSH